MTDATFSPPALPEESEILQRRYVNMKNHLELAVPDLGQLADAFDERLTYVDPDAMPLPFDGVDNAAYDPDLDLYPDGLADAIMIDAIHVGDLIPKPFVHDVVTNVDIPDASSEITAGYYREKDWGARHLALALARCLNLPRFYQVNVARVLLDYGRFPGITPTGKDAGHLYRKAINYPFSELSHPLKMSLLKNYYNKISEQVEYAVRGKILKVAIHTYDPYDELGERIRGPLRPDVSLVFSPIGYHVEKRMPLGLFDPLYPDELGVFSADRRLIARITLDLEREGITVAYNYPYHLPEGSVEVRAQVWTFFEHLKEEFVRDHPETRDEMAYDLVWDMLLDTNLRSPNAEVVRSYIHMFRETPQVFSGPRNDPAAPGRESWRYVADRLEEARLAYENVGRYLKANYQHLVTEYRRSAFRTSALVVEVRKDILWEYEDDRGRKPVKGPRGLKVEGLQQIAYLLSKAILTYLNKDRRDLMKL